MRTSRKLSPTQQALVWLLAPVAAIGGILTFPRFQTYWAFRLLVGLLRLWVVAIPWD